MTGGAEATLVAEYDCLGPSMLPTLRAGDAVWVVDADGFWADSKKAGNGI